MYQFTDKLNLKNPNKNIALANLSIYYTRKTLNLNTATTNSKFLLQHRMMNLIYLIDVTTLNKFKITLNTLLKNMKLLETKTIFLYKFMSIK